MSDEEDSYIICMRKTDAGLATIADGSTLTNCCECDEPVWISPASVQLMLERNLRPLCLYCIQGKPPPDGIHPPSAEQLKEVIRTLKKELKNEDTTDRFKDRGD